MSDISRRKNTATSAEGKKARPSAVRPPNASDPDYVLLVEREFVAQWYHLAWVKNPAAVEVAQHVPPESISDRYYREAYEYLSEKHAKGEQVDDLETDSVLLQLAKKHKDGMARLETLNDYFGATDHEEDMRAYGRKVLSLHRSRSQVEILKGALAFTEEAIINGGNIRQVADNLLDRLINLHSRNSESGGPVTQSEIAQHLLKKMNREAPLGYPWPWPKLQRTLGLIGGGKVIGITGYSGGGKSLFTTNLAGQLIIRGVPVIIFPTEMDLQWLKRMVAELAGIPKQFAEEDDWRNATDEHMERYQKAMLSLVGLNWEIVMQPGISPAEVMARTRILRRKYKGKLVLVITDHMHRLDYPDGISADEAMGAPEATKQQKNMARQDKDGLTWINLYQPKKPPNEEDQFKPVFGMTGMRGHSGGFNELDIHFSVWRRLVKCTPHMKTPWGTPLAVYKSAKDPLPERGTYGEEDTKVDDEHMYITADKHRIRGGSTETIVLDVDDPSGRVYERDWMRETLDKPMKGER